MKYTNVLPGLVCAMIALMVLMLMNVNAQETEEFHSETGCCEILVIDDTVFWIDHIYGDKIEEISFETEDDKEVVINYFMDRCMDIH
jgi:hypothetical protein